MKKCVFLLVGISIINFSCSSDDDVSATSGNYQPLGSGNYWNYDVQGTETSERDSLYVSNDTVMNGKTYRKMRVGNVPVGFFSNTLNKNFLRIDGGKVYMSGNAGLALGDFLPLDLELSDFIIFDENANPTQQLSSLTGNIEQMVEEIPLNINYVFSSESGQSYPTYTTPGGIIYNNVKSVKLKLNLKITATYLVGNFPISIPVLNPQDVVLSERFYAPNVGMIYSTTKLSYELQDFSDLPIEIPIPQSGQEIQTEILDTYNVE